MQWFEKENKVAIQSNLLLKQKEFKTQNEFESQAKLGNPKLNQFESHTNIWLGKEINSEKKSKRNQKTKQII